MTEGPAQTVSGLDRHNSPSTRRTGAGAQLLLPECSSQANMQQPAHASIMLIQWDGVVWQRPSLQAAPSMSDMGTVLCVRGLTGGAAKFHQRQQVHQRQGAPVLRWSRGEQAGGWYS